MVSRWVIAKAEPAAAGALAGALNLPTPLAQALLNRGHCHAEAAWRFLHPQLRHLADPFALPDMTAATERIQSAIHRRERIVIYGDYDVDGITSCALLTHVLRAAGGDVTTFLPHRMEEGYGLSRDGVARCIRECAPQLLIAVDCGTSSPDEIADLNSQGIQTIVIDHHEPSTALPACVALVNPKRGDGDPLASVGVSFKLAHALLKSNRQWKIDLREHLDLVALGTVADVVPLVGENRILVKAGLKQLAHTNKIGLRALMELAGVPDIVTPYHVGFRLAPRLNAAGRLSDARVALELLLTSDGDRATELANVLHEHNSQRQQIEERIVEEAMAQARQQPDANVLVLSSPDWHIGVIGIVASRVLQECYRPTIVIGADGKGSCRSIPGFSIIVALTECASLLERFGGHDMAAGLTVRPENIPSLAKKLHQIASQVLSEEQRTPSIMVDAEVRLADLDAAFFDGLKNFEPCGPGNPTPLFVVRRVALRGTPRVVVGKHLKFFVTDGEMTAPAIWFGAAEATLPSSAMDLVFAAELDEFRGEPTVQLRVRDVHSCHG